LREFDEILATTRREQQADLSEHALNPIGATEFLVPGECV